MALQRSALWAVALAAVAMALPTPARADHGTPLLDDALTTYFGVAQAYWQGPLPTCVLNGVTTITAHAVLYDDPDASVAARADQPGCRLWLDRRQWREMGPVEACTIVVHEWGHLLGLGHSEDPFDLMAEFPARPPYRCARLGRKVRAARGSGRDRLRCEVHATRAGGTKRLRTAKRAGSATRGGSAKRPHIAKRPRSAKRPRFACITRG